MHAPPATSGDVVADAVARLHGLLPDQGPIGVFVHHNTLHALQHRPFHDAVVEGHRALGTRAYPALSLLRDAWRRGRITDADVDAVLDDDVTAGALADGVVACGVGRRALVRALLRDDLFGDIDDAVAIAAAHRDDALYARVLPLVPARSEALPRPRRHHDVYGAHGVDVDADVHDELARLALSFLDLGQADVSLPGRAAGFLRAALPVLAQGSALDVRAAAALAANKSARAIVDDALAALGVDGDDAGDWLFAAGIALRGVAGMFSRFERHPDEAGAPTTLLEFLAVRLVIEVPLLARAAKRARLPLSFAALKRAVDATRARPAAVDAALVAGLLRGHADANAVTAADVVALVDAARAVDVLTLERLLFLAFERRYRVQTLDAVAALRAHRTAPSTTTTTATATTTTTTATTATTTTTTATRPRAHVVFCIDEREESIRRALEEQAPDVATHGAAGFFGMAIDYRGVDDRDAAAYCPVVVVPAHEVHEAPLFTARRWHALRARWRATFHQLERLVWRASRGLIGGAGVSMVAGPLAAAAAASRVAAPRQSRRAYLNLSRRLAPPPSTRLLSLRPTVATAVDAKKPLGFSVDEAADRVVSVLKNLGLTGDAAHPIARVVCLLGHGSTSLNNPHESAHDCGACGGRRGGANARLFAELANHPEVRAAALVRGVAIPSDTWFVGGVHDTADDSIAVADLEAVPVDHVDDVDALVADLDVARKESARERCRRFHHAPLGLSPDDALLHVEERASHLAQPRPEYGHCTNASAFVGRRALTRGLHLDRRAFLVSYDPTVDSDGAILERILAAVGPVGAGINLEYYFSSIDNEGYGCGTKLPHNVTGLLGVQNGQGGDLRTGLPLQMVELHEPMRLLLVVEATPERLLAIAGRQAEVHELVTKGWVQLVSVDPDTGAQQVFTGAGFTPHTPQTTSLPQVARSVDWHGASRDYVGPALVTSALQVRP